MADCADAAGASSSAKDTFLCGVCEGFYGKPWTTEQRRELFVRMNRMGMTTYLYAPKDDSKHRLCWRELYSDDEAEDIRSLIESAKENNITFVYALSPGLDITYSDEEDVKHLHDKLDQVLNLGCTAFALLFDDIETDLIEEDDNVFKSVAQAQCTVTNNAYNHLNKPHIFLFCPTEYCTTRATPDLPKSTYLKCLGDQLDKGIDILWTGPKVISRRITLTGIRDVIKLIGRNPVIWDNLHANDYDQTRIYLGPYDGRSQELRKLLRGVLTNPNCEFEANFIAMHTLAQWSKNLCESYPIRRNSRTSPEMETEKFSATKYNPKAALQFAVGDWLPELYKVKNCGRKPQSTPDAQKDSNMEVNMETDEMDVSQPQKTKKKTSSEKPSPYGKLNSIRPREKQKVEELERLTVSDVLLICDLFYLPYEYGPRAVHLLKEAHWLISNVDRVANVQTIPKSEHSPQVKEWYEKAIHFHQCHKDVCLVVDKFVNIPNKDLLYEMYNYISDMRSCLSLVNSYIKWHGLGKSDKEPFRKSEQEPWVNRGGIYSEFRRLLPIEGQSDMFPPPKKLISGNRVFTIRPYYEEDREDVYKVCLNSCDDGLDGSDIFPDHPELVADECIGCLLAYFTRHCYVLEDDAGICGYVAAAPDIKEYHKVLEESWLPKMREKYPKPSSKSKSESSDASHDDAASPTPTEEIIETFHKELRPIPQIVKDSYPAFIQIQTLPPRVEGLHTPTLLLDACIKGLKNVGVEGIHTLLHSNQLYTLTFMFKLGFDEINVNEKENVSDILLFGRAI